ncbi:MAG: flagella basal body P-ring formation protein FlgA [Alcanivorax sp.]|jgi:flagella basal body P-ring formation protein FlgA
MTIFWRYLLPAGLLTGGLLITIPVTAGGTQALESITAAATAASAIQATQRGYTNVTVDTAPLAPNLQLPECDKPLVTIPAQSSRVLGSINVRVKCPGENPWTIYVRTQVSAITVIPVLVRPIARNTLISKDDIKMIDLPLHSAPMGNIYDPNQIIGMELTRSLDAGSSLKLNQLRQPKVILRGQQVVLVTRINGLQVTMQGTAKKDAIAGQRIVVTNSGSGTSVEGIAQADGTVEIP